VVDIGTAPTKLALVLDTLVIHPSLNDLPKQPGKPIAVECRGGYRVLPFQIKLRDLQQFDPVQHEILFQMLQREEGQADILLLNIPFDMTQADLFCYLQFLHETILVVSLQDLLGAYRNLKVLFSIRPSLHVGLIEHETNQSAYRGGIHRLVSAAK